MYSLPTHWIQRWSRINGALIVKPKSDIVVSVKVHNPAALPAGKRPQYPLCRRLDVYHDRTGVFENRDN